MAKRENEFVTGKQKAAIEKRRMRAGKNIRGQFSEGLKRGAIKRAAARKESAALNKRIKDLNSRYRKINAYAKRKGGSDSSMGRIRQNAAGILMNMRLNAENRRGAINEALKGVGRAGG